MATILSFEEMEIWQLTMKQANELCEIYIRGDLAKRLELPNGEVCSQLNRALDRNHITFDIFEDLLTKNKTLSSKITSLIKYLKSSNRKGFRYEQSGQ